MKVSDFVLLFGLGMFVTAIMTTIVNIIIPIPEFTLIFWLTMVTGVVMIFASNHLDVKEELEN